MQFSKNSDLPTCEAATITMFVTFGSLKAFIGSSRYGVLEVRHGPASAAFSGESLRNFSAHSDTVSSSGGAKFLTAGAMAAFSLFIAVFVPFFKIFSLPIPNAFFVGIGIVLVIRQLVQYRVNLFPHPR